MSKEINPCRPDKNHYCITCCSKGCPLLKVLDDDMMGCINHPLSKNHDPKIKNGRGICNLDICLDTRDSETLKKVSKFVSSLPPGLFDMEKVKDILGIS